MKTIALLLFLFSSEAFAQFIPILQPPTQPAQPPATSAGQPAQTGSAILVYPFAYIVPNPAIVVYQNAYSVGLTHDQIEAVKGYGVNAGYGQDFSGISIEYYDADCVDCGGRVTGDIASTFGESTAVGVRLSDRLVSLGFLFNTMGIHQVGLVAEVNDIQGQDNRITSYGLGYAFNPGVYSLSLDITKQDFRNSTGVSNNVLMLAPGAMLFVEEFNFSVNDRITMEGNTKVAEETWWGIGLGTKAFQLAAYSNFNHVYSFAATAFF